MASRVLFLFLFATITIPALSAHASTLFFDSIISERQKILIHDYFEKELKAPSDGLSVAKADLNEDGLMEFIVRSGCDKKKAGMCDFRALAESGEKLVKLADIRAMGIELGNAYAGGVRNIIAFKDVINDFQRSVYIWDPGASQYIIKE